MIIYSFILFSKSKIDRMKNRIEFLHSCVEFFTNAKKMVVMYKTSVYDLYQAYCEQHQNELSDMLRCNLNNGLSAMIEMINQKIELKSEKELLTDFFINFGKTVASLQVAQLDDIIAQIETIISSATEKYTATKALYYKLSVLIGIGGSVLLW